MTGSSIYLGRVGNPVLLSAPVQGVDMSLERPTATTDLLSGAKVVDRVGRGRRKYTLNWEHLTADELHTVEWLALLPGPLVLDMPDRRNRLTANQSAGSSVLRTTEGCIVRTQGTVSSSTAQSRSNPRSFAWDTVSSLSATGRGLILANSTTVPDDTWHPVRVGGVYTASGYLRASGSVSMQAVIEWYSSAPALLSTSSGTGMAIGTGDFNSRPTVTGTAPANAAYGLVGFLNTTSPGATRIVYLDDPQMEEAASVSAYVLGTGVPRVSVVETPATSLLMGYTSPSLTLQEL